MSKLTKKERDQLKSKREARIYVCSDCGHKLPAKDLAHKHTGPVGCPTQGCGGVMFAEDAPEADKEKLAEQFGYEAAQSGASRAPAHCRRTMDLLKGNQVGEGLPVLNAFGRGYQRFVDQVAAQALGDGS